MAMYLTPTEQRLTSRARRIASDHGLRALGLNDGYSGVVRVAKLPVGNRYAYIVSTSDGGTGTVLGETGHTAEDALVAIARDAT